jgi:hypothetical protein
LCQFIDYNTGGSIDGLIAASKENLDSNIHFSALQHDISCLRLRHSEIMLLRGSQR